MSKLIRVEVKITVKHLSSLQKQIRPIHLAANVAMLGYSTPSRRKIDSKRQISPRKIHGRDPASSPVSISNCSCLVTTLSSRLNMRQADVVFFTSSYSSLRPPVCCIATLGLDKVNFFRYVETRSVTEKKLTNNMSHETDDSVQDGGS